MIYTHTHKQKECVTVAMQHLVLRLIDVQNTRLVGKSHKADKSYATAAYVTAWGLVFGEYPAYLALKTRNTGLEHLQAHK